MHTCTYSFSSHAGAWKVKRISNLKCDNTLENNFKRSRNTNLGFSPLPCESVCSQPNMKLFYFDWFSQDL